MSSSSTTLISTRGAAAATTTLSLTGGDPALRRSYSLPTREEDHELPPESTTTTTTTTTIIRHELDHQHNNTKKNGKHKEAAAATTASPESKTSKGKNTSTRIIYNRLGQQQQLLRQSKSDDIQQRHKLDRYGFIVNMDSHGNVVVPDEDEDHHNNGATPLPEHGTSASNTTTSSSPLARRRGRPPPASAATADPLHSATRQDAEDERTATAAARVQRRRTKKWELMLSKWNSFKKSKLVKKRLRKGIPDEQRGMVWPVLCGIDEKIQQHPGLYKQLVEQSVGGNHKSKMKNGSSNSTTTGMSASSNNQQGDNISKESRVASPTSNIEAQIGNPKETAAAEQQEVVVPRRANGEPITFEYTKSFKVIQDTIERDIHRTFPRHSMFYKSDDDPYGENDPDLSDAEEETDAGGTFASFNDENSAIYQTSNLCGDTTDRLRHMMLLPRSETIRSIPSLSVASLTREASNTTRYSLIPTGNANGDTFDPARIFDGAGGQARLRRVLKAYSTYDREIGYCQGMNFIAAMFLTLMPEERAFWMLVSVMYDEPCRMRGLFGEGMRETHKVLYVAEKLIHQFLPRLAKHLDKEMIHVTMYATQWLLTQYTSSFKFDIVTRVWDSFLYEGWKVTYRVMLSILQRCQPTLLAMSFEETLGFFRDLPERPEINASVIDEAIKIPLKTSHIVKFENQWRVQQEQLEQQQQQQGSAASS